MGLFDRGSAPSLVAARVLDGEHLFLAVRDTDALWLRTAAGQVALPVTADVDELGPLTSAVVRLADHLDPQEESPVWPILASQGRKVVAPVGEPPSVEAPGLLAPRTSDGDWQWSVTTEGGPAVRREPADAGVTVLAIETPDEPEGEGSSSGSAVRVRFAAGPDDAVEVRRQGNVVDRLPVRRDDDGTRLLRLLDVPGLVEGSSRLYADGAPLTRRRHHLTRPGHATVLPPTGVESLELRWTKQGHLALHRAAPDGPA